MRQDEDGHAANEEGTTRLRRLEARLRHAVDALSRSRVDVAGRHSAALEAARDRIAGVADEKGKQESAMIFAGIDPGFKGALVAMSATGKVLLAEGLPVLGTAGKPGDYNARACCDLVLQTQGLASGEGLGGGLFVCVESPPRFIHLPGGRKMPATVLREGVRLFEGILVGLGIPYELPSPKEWQKEICKGKPKAIGHKDWSVAVCGQLFPELNLTPGKRQKPWEDLAEAALVAEYGRRRWHGRQASE